MSVIRKLPYIEELLASMSDANLKSLHTILNTGGNNVSLSFATLTTSYKNKVTPVYFQLDDNNVKTGILIYTNTMCVLICYHKYQDLLLIKLNVTNHTYEKVNEYCDINELRRILDDTFESKGQIESGDAAEGTVPIADGSGGTVWGKASSTFEGADIESGNAIALLGIDSNGDLVKDTIPEGIVVDETLDGASTNAVSNQAVVGGLDDVKDMITEEYDTTATYNTGDYVIYNNTLYKCKAASVTGTWDATKWDAVNVGDELNNKANKDGNYPTMSVGEADVAKNIKAYSSDSGVLQENPFINQGTGTNNNTEIVTTGDYCEIKSKNGNTIVVNQIAKEFNATNYSRQSVNITVSFNDGVATLTKTTGVSGFYDGIGYSVSDLLKHYYLVIVKAKSSTSSNLRIAFVNSSTSVYIRTSTFNLTSSYNTYFALINCDAPSYNSSAKFQVGFDDTANENDVLDIADIRLIDLTQMFNGNIPQDLLDNPSHFSWYYNGDLSYGSRLVNANGRYLECGQGRNLFNPATVTSDKIINPYGTETSASGYSHSDYISVVPNTKYYVKNISAIAHYYCVLCYDANKTFIKPLNEDAGTNYKQYTIPSNCWYIIVNVDNNELATQSVSKYYTPEQGGEGYDQYYPYVAPKVIDTGSEELLAFDKKTPDGTIYENTGGFNLNALILTEESAGVWYQGTSSLEIPANNNTKARIIVDKYQVVAYNDLATSDKCVALKTDGRLYIKDTSLSSSSEVNGNLQYFKKTPTTSQGTAFQAYPDINDYSYMLWKDTDNALVEIPQGASIFYPVNYAGTLDDLVAYVDGDVTNLAKKSDLASDKAELQGVDTQLLNAIGGTLRQMLAISKNIDFLNTDVVDLSTLSWNVTEISVGKVSALINNIKAPANNDTLANILCSELQNDDYTTVNSSSAIDITIAYGIYGYLQLKWTSKISSATDTREKVQQALKGVLLAYEKASV